MNCLFRALFINLFVLLSVTAAEDGKLQGRVIDTESGSPLVGANISVEGTILGAATDDNGSFIIPSIPEGRYSIRVSYVGYGDKLYNNIEITAGETRTLDVGLFPTSTSLNPITVSASNRPEKLLESPASVGVMDAEEIESRIVTTPAEHLKSMNGVEVASTGLNQSIVTARGFASVNSGDLLSLVDNRIARVPSVRINDYRVISTSNEDIERIEVVLGPGSALYGPNSANGVFHLLTKSPFGTEGTSVNLGAGQRDILMGAVRHAGSISDKLGYKITAQYYEGTDFESTDPVEEQARQDAIDQGADPDTLLIGARNYDIDKLALEARLDYRFNPDAMLILNTGYNRGSAIQLSEAGATQTVDGEYTFFQGRFTYKNLFVQAFLNKNDAGGTYLLRTGNPVIENSSLFVTQLQHFYEVSDRQLFTYGADILLTRPNTGGTVNGRNEDDDDINEVGGYLQSETQFFSSLKFVAALRLDHHNRLDELNFSPRAALVYSPTSSHTFRATYNRAFNTPSTNNLFLDFLGASVSTASAVPPDQLDLLASYIGETLFNVRISGTPRDGYNFNFAQDGRAQMVSLYGPALAEGGFIASENEYMAPDVNPVWPAIRQLSIDGAPDEVTRNLLEATLPQTLSETIPGQHAALNSTTGEFDPVDPASIRDVELVKPRINNTFEVGYKGLLNKGTLITVDAYYTKINNFIGPLQVETPHVLVDSAMLADVLVQDMVDNNVPEIIARGLAGEVAGNVDDLPIGIISPMEVQNATDAILTYRNFGDISLGGFDLGFTQFLNRRWSVGGNYSFISKDFFPAGDGQLHPIALNAPKHKAGLRLQYNSDSGLGGQLRYRWSDSFPVNSGVYVGTVNAYSVVDLNLNYTMPFSQKTNVSLTVQNLLDHKHIEMVGAPEIGRVAIARLSQVF